ncbi:MAG: choice-of-anchor J domain-containing protein [Muribaculaceae bacterium]|nr:choice-of-anchor J domain-containing protein [Muribaculaceae bacterium]
MKKFFTAASVLAMSMCMMAPNAAAVSTLSYIFKEGNTANLTLKAYNQGSLQSQFYNISKYGLTNGWSLKKITDEKREDAYGVNALISCSRLTNDVTPDNWLILPAFTVAPNATLEWSAKSIHDGLHDSYDVMISTSGTAKEDFKLLTRVEKESYFFNRHIISLKEYQGQNVTIAFVHNDGDGYMLAIEEIHAGYTNRGFKAQNIGYHFFGRNEEQFIDFEITNFGGKANTTIEQFQLVNAEDSGDVLATAEPNNIGDIANTFTISFPLNLDVNTYKDYILQAVYADGSTDDLYSDFVNVSESKRKVFIEKYTATWCNACPGVYYVTHSYLNRLGKDAVYLEAHVQNAIGADKMAIDEYVAPYQYSLGGNFPAVWINREAKQNDTNVRDISAYTKAVKSPCTADVKLVIESYDYETVKAHAVVKSHETLDNSDGNYRVAFSVAQKHVPLPENNLPQTNNCTGSTIQTRGEYNFLPANLPKEYTSYTNVVIGPEDGFRGADNTLPETIEAGKEYIVPFEFEIPKNADPENLMMVANFNYHKENKGGVPFPSLNIDKQDLVQTSVGVDAISARYGTIEYRIEGDNLVISLPKDGKYTINFFTTLGEKIYSESGEGNEVIIPVNTLTPGIALCSINQNNQKFNLKLMLK